MGRFRAFSAKCMEIYIKMGINYRRESKIWLITVTTYSKIKKVIIWRGPLSPPSSWTNFWKVHLKLSMNTAHTQFGKTVRHLGMMFPYERRKFRGRIKIFKSKFFLWWRQHFVCTPLPPSLSPFVINSADPLPPPLGDVIFEWPHKIIPSSTVLHPLLLKYSEVQKRGKIHNFSKDERWLFHSFLSNRFSRFVQILLPCWIELVYQQTRAEMEMAQNYRGFYFRCKDPDTPARMKLWRLNRRFNSRQPLHWKEPSPFQPLAGSLLAALDWLYPTWK